MGYVSSKPMAGKIAKWSTIKALSRVCLHNTGGALALLLVLHSQAFAFDELTPTQELIYNAPHLAKNLHR